MVLLTSEVTNIADKSIDLFGALVKEFGSQYPALALFGLIFIAILALFIFVVRIVINAFLKFLGGEKKQSCETQSCETQPTMSPLLYTKLDNIEKELSEIKGVLMARGAVFKEASHEPSHEEGAKRSGSS